MALLSFKDWLSAQESSAASRAFAAAVSGLYPSTAIVSHGIGGHRTEPSALAAFEKIKIADDPNSLDKKKKKKKRKKRKKRKRK